MSVTRFLAVVSILISGSLFAAPITPTGNSVPGEVLVKLQAGTSNDEIASLEHGADVDRGERISKLHSGEIWRLHSRSQKTDALATALQHNPRVVYAEPNYIVHIGVTPNDTSYSQLWGMNNTGQSIGGSFGSAGADIRAEAAWGVTTGSASVVVGVVDTGIDYNHPDLAANVWSNPGGKGNVACAAGTHGFNAITNTCDPMDDHYHGTHVSGTIGAVGNNSLGVVGVNWTTSIMGLKFLDYSGSGTTAGAIAAIDFAVQAKIDGVNVRVLSNSWGGGAFSKALLDEINKAGENDILFVAAAGNDSSSNDYYPHYPANYGTPNLISVAATDNRDALAYFSDYGATTVHLGAPGVSVYSTTPGGNYTYLSGTSMATPHVSGVAALVLATSPNLTTAQVKSAILNNVDPIASLSGLTITGGRLNAAKAVGATLPPDFKISASPSSRTLAPGASTTYSINVNPSGGFNGSVDLSISSLPTGITAAFSSTPTTSSSIVTVTADNSAVINNTYTLIITGTAGALTRSTTVNLSMVAATPPVACGSLSAPLALYLSVTPAALAKGDFNRDGIADVVMVSPTNSTAVALGRGDGGFYSPSYLPGTTGSPIGVAVGDFNGDGKADIALADSASSNVTIRLGNGDGTFQSPVNYAAGSSPFWVATADFNGDGKADLAVANNGSANVSILLGQGDGTFAAPVNYATGSGPFWVTPGDFNGDGKTDLAVAAYNANKVSILLGNGDGTFQPKTDFAVGSGPTSVAIGDFNADGKQDLAVSNYASGNVSVLLGAGNGTFTAPVQYAAGGGANSVVVFDVNGDNKPDLAVVGTVSLGVLRGVGDGTFLAATYSQAVSPSQVIVGDFDRDGRPDLATIDVSYYSYLFVYRNTGTCSANCGTIGAAVNYTSGTTPRSVYAGDLNGDGKADLAIANNAANSVSIAMGNGDGTFQTAVDYGAGTGPRSIRSADVNGDGKPDLVVADSSTNQVSILLANSGGTFQGAVAYNTGTAPHAVTTGDFNGDGKADLAVANSGSSNVSILLGYGDGTFHTAVNYSAGTTPESVVTGDFNRDGKADLAVANSGSNNVSILLGNGDGTFQTATTYSAGTSPVALAVGDFNRDGKLDLAVANSGSNNLSILVGNGSGGFASAVNYLVGTSPSAVLTHDFNGDGIPDVAIANSGSNNATLLIGNGDGTFIASANYSAGTAPVSIATADFNGDGKPDLALANSGSNNVSVLLNTCPQQDLVVTKTHSGSFAQGDTGKSYTITVSNAGGAPTTGAVSVTENPPLGLLPAAMSGSGWTCTLGTLTCSRADALGANASYPAITLTANVSSGAPVTLVNTVTVTGGGESNTLNDTATDSASVTQVTDLVVSLTHSDSFTQGATARRYTIGVRNAGGAPTAGQITVTDTLPAGLTATAMSGTGWSCNAGSLTCTRTDSLPAASAAAPITLTVNVSASAPVSVINLATVSGGGETNTANDTAQDATTIWSSTTCGGLLQGVTTPAGTYPWAIVKADFNRDGKTDLAVTNNSSSMVSILIGNGNGTFAAPVSYAVGDNPLAIAASDFNGDGNIDLVVANYYSGNVSILIGNGDGTFASAVAYSVGSTNKTLTALTVGDFNGDGNADVAAATSSGYIYLFRGNGNGTMQPALGFNPGGDLLSLTSADVDGDGKLDLITADSNGTNMFLLKGNGDGTFQSAITIAVGYNSSGVYLADFNGDGKVDVAVTHNYYYTITVLLGNGDGTFQTPVDDPVNYYSVSALAIDDLNGDGKLDLVGLGNGYVFSLLGNGDGTFRPASGSYTGYYYGHLAIGDFNADGSADLAITDDNYNGNVAILSGGCTDLSITKTHSGSFVAGQTGNYILTIHNAGASTFGPVTVKDILPDGLAIYSIYTDYGWQCDLATVQCVLTNPLSAGATSTITVTVSISKTAPAVVVNQATVSGGGDGNAANNAASDTTNITFVPDLTITKSHIGTFVAGDTGKTYTITVANVGSAPTSAPVTVTDQLPSWFTATAISGQGWNCNLGSLTCTRSDALAVNAAYPSIVLTVNVLSWAGGDTSNYANVSGGGELYTYNNSVYDQTRVLYSPYNLVATAVLPTQVNLSWYYGYPYNLPTFQVFRSTDNVTFTLIATPTSTSYVDTSLTPNTAYVYKVRAVDASANGPFSSIDLATTILFTNDPIAVGSTPLLASHIIELRTAINAVRTAASLSVATFTDPSLAGKPIKAVHLTELQAALDQARSALGLPAAAYPAPTAATGIAIRAADITALRNGVK